MNIHEIIRHFSNCNINVKLVNFTTEHHIKKNIFLERGLRIIGTKEELEFLAAVILGLAYSETEGEMIKISSEEPFCDRESDATLQIIKEK